MLPGPSARRLEEAACYNWDILANRDWCRMPSEWQRVAMLLWSASPQSVLSKETQTGLRPIALKMKLLEEKLQEI